VTPELAQTAAPRGRWHPTPLIAGSIGLHCMAGIGALFGPEAWAWALGSVVANHAILGGLGMWPRSTLLGPNVRRLPGACAARGEIALTFDDGPDPEVTPRVLELLQARRMHATFFCIGSAASRHPDICREIADRGHRIENHSHHHHATFPFLWLGGIRAEIGAAQSLLTAIAGAPPRFFRPPAGLRNPLLDPVLHELGLALVSWTRRAYDTRRSDPQRAAARLLDGIAGGDILLLHDGHCARTRSGTPVVLEVLPRILDAVEHAGLRPVTLHQALRA
jgi:peptidoglycan/xylan/chitin deacetylase (PgdA/CDA1 family)